MTEWTAAQCAAAWGIKPPTWRAYVARNQAPQPVRHVSRTPLWDSAAVLAARPAAVSSVDAAPPKLELRLPDTLHTLAANLTVAADQTAKRDEREEAGRDADAALHATARVLTRLRDFCHGEGERTADVMPEGDGDEALRMDAERIAWFDLMEDFNRLAAQASARAGVARHVTAEYEDV